MNQIPCLVATTDIQRAEELDEARLTAPGLSHNHHRMSSHKAQINRHHLQAVVERQFVRPGLALRGHEIMQVQAHHPPQRHQLHFTDCVVEVVEDLDVLGEQREDNLAGEGWHADVELKKLPGVGVDEPAHFSVNVGAQEGHCLAVGVEDHVGMDHVLPAAGFVEREGGQVGVCGGVEVETGQAEVVGH